MNTIAKSTADWVGNARANILAWWIPKGAIIAALFALVPVRAANDKAAEMIGPYRQACAGPMRWDRG